MAAGTVAAVIWMRTDDPPSAPTRARADRRGSVVAPDVSTVDIVRTPLTYRVVYRLEEFTGTKVSLSTDKVWVRRPFESRLETWVGAPPGEHRFSTQVGRFGLRRNVGNSGEEAVVIGVPPAPGPSDLRLAPALPLALDRGLLERREVRRVEGRPCQVYRSGQPLSTAVLTPPTPADHVDSCIDGAGLLLEEVLVSDGDVLARRVAVEVEEGVELDDRLFTTGERTLEVRDGGGLVRRLGPEAPEGEFFVLDPAAVPAGFVRTDRYNVIPSQPENFNDPMREGARETSFTDVYVRGTDYFVVDQGGTLRGVDPFPTDASAPTVDLGGLGMGEVRLSALGVEVRAKLLGGRFVRLRGTLPPDELATIGRALVSTQGSGPLEFLEEPAPGVGSPRP